MNRVPAYLLALALAPASFALSQTPDASLSQQPPAPIERPHYQPTRPQPQFITTQPVAGVRVLSEHALETVSSKQGTVELRLTHGRANIGVSHPEAGTLILIDLPGGQVDLVADGFYTLNADTNTVRVLQGEAQVFPPDAPANAKGVTVHEAEQATLTGDLYATRITPADEHADLLQPGYSGGSYAGGYGGYPRPYGFAGYPYAYAAPYPYYGAYYGGWGYPYAYGYGYGWDYPWYPGWGFGWGYPYWGWGLGWGWGGGYWGGFGGWDHSRGFGYGGGYGGGFHPGASGGGVHPGGASGGAHR